MAQQTATQWLALRYHHRQGYLSQEDIAEANKMFEQQIKNAVIYGLDEDGHTGDWKISVAQKYYNEKHLGIKGLSD